MFGFDIPMTPEVMHTIFLSQFSSMIKQTTLSTQVKNELDSFFLDKFVRVLLLFTNDQRDYSMKHLTQLSRSFCLLSVENAKT